MLCDAFMRTISLNKTLGSSLTYSFFSILEVFSEISRTKSSKVGETVTSVKNKFPKSDPF
ncbi:hypothetical protein Hdeb2414_s0172g00822481 [Helianthus debilis subsp. tardiflorus]